MRVAWIVSGDPCFPILPVRGFFIVAKLDVPCENSTWDVQNAAKQRCVRLGHPGLSRFIACKSRNIFSK
jgi:hypothetical protein